MRNWHYPVFCLSSTSTPPPLNNMPILSQKMSGKTWLSRILFEIHIQILCFPSPIYICSVTHFVRLMIIINILRHRHHLPIASFKLYHYCFLLNVSSIINTIKVNKLLQLKRIKEKNYAFTFNFNWTFCKEFNYFHF